MIIPLIDIKTGLLVRCFEYNTTLNVIEVVNLDPHTLLPINKYTMKDNERVEL